MTDATLEARGHDCEWDEIYDDVVVKYNQRIHSVTGMTPNDAWNQTKINDASQDISVLANQVHIGSALLTRETIANKQKKAAERNVKRRNKKKPETTFTEGTKVMGKKLDTRKRRRGEDALYMGEGTIIKVQSGGRYIIRWETIGPNGEELNDETVYHVRSLKEKLENDNELLAEFTTQEEAHHIPSDETPNQIENFPTQTQDQLSQDEPTSKRKKRRIEYRIVNGKRVYE